jgi:hypothetical protein
MTMIFSALIFAATSPGSRIMQGKFKLVAAAAVASMGLSVAAGEASPDGVKVGCVTQHPGRVDQPADEIVLVHRFTIPQKLAWGKVGVKFAPEVWRVGNPSGPVAKAAQLRMVLGTLSGIEIGGRCTGWVEGAAAYPCGFAVRSLGIDSQVGDRYSGVATDWTPDPTRAQAAIDARPQANMHGLISPLPDTQRFVGLQVPPHQLGDPHHAFGSRLAFEIRVVSNPLVPSLFDRATGQVILCGGGKSLPA